MGFQAKAKNFGLKAKLGLTSVDSDQYDEEQKMQKKFWFVNYWFLHVITTVVNRPEFFGTIPCPEWLSPEQANVPNFHCAKK